MNKGDNIVVNVIAPILGIFVAIPLCLLMIQQSNAKTELKLHGNDYTYYIDDNEVSNKGLNLSKYFVFIDEDSKVAKLKKKF